ncbi:hypothetical protein SAMN05192588_2707 [Nonlabens sp. Hel1_33_55]|uniref:hypothetical protein n=1 Tax=Nonlabens sp. Hel1_33_55 TaxID=1336802 RepID=UPI000875C1C0|nr:hypothetical protein [Nonlabens sp. Hel1_33_55]SCY40570.1 hypothetical protein SAMN05192588_2707 [Nonlabens sp. Hel1_33_55]
MNLAFLCLYTMRESYSYFLLALLCLGLTSCDDGTDMDNDLVEILEPIDDLVRLHQIRIEDSNQTIIQDINIEYGTDSLITQIRFSGMQDAVFTMEYAINDRLVAFEKLENGQTTSNSLEYSNNTILVRTTLPDMTVEERELVIDFQNRINLVRSYQLNNDGSRSIVDQTQYVYTQNFNVERVNNLSASGNRVESSIELTYFFNNNPFRDMNDVIRFLIFNDFVPYTRYLPSTLEERINSNGPPIDSRFVSFEYTLQEDDFPSSRMVETTTPTGLETTTETFIYQP